MREVECGGSRFGRECDRTRHVMPEPNTVAGPTAVFTPSAALPKPAVNESESIFRSRLTFAPLNRKSRSSAQIGLFTFATLACVPASATPSERSTDSVILSAD